MNPRGLRFMAIGLVVLLGDHAYAWKSGAPAGYNGSIASEGKTCMVCHYGGGGAGMVEILGAPTAYGPDLLYDLTVRISDSEQLGAGFELSVEDAKGSHVGELILSDPLRTLEAPGDPGWVTHSFFGEFETVQQWDDNGQSAEYHVQWRAPSSDVGEITFYAVGNAVNDSGQPDGDHIYLVSQSSTFSFCPVDVNADGFVDPLDLGFVLARLGCIPDDEDPDCLIADVNSDGQVDPLDAGDILTRFGACDPEDAE